MIKKIKLHSGKCTFIYHSILLLWMYLMYISLRKDPITSYIINLNIHNHITETPYLSAFSRDCTKMNTCIDLHNLSISKVDMKLHWDNYQERKSTFFLKLHKDLVNIRTSNCCYNMLLTCC